MLHVLSAQGVGENVGGEGVGDGDGEVGEGVGDGVGIAYAFHILLDDCVLAGQEEKSWQYPGAVSA